MNPTPQQKRFAGAVILLLVFCFLVPFFVTGTNVNRDREAVARLSDPELRGQFARQQAQEEETARLEQEARRQEEIRQRQQEAEAASRRENRDSGSDDVVIVENTPAGASQQDKDAAAAAARTEARRQETARLEAEKARAEAEKRRKNEEAQRLEREKQARLAEAKRREQDERDRRKAQELAARQSGQQRVTVINGDTRKRTEINVMTPAEAEAKRRAAAQTATAAGTPVQPVARNGEKYNVSLGVFSSMTNAQNVKNKVSGICAASIMPFNRNNQRMFKVVCGRTSDMNTIRSIQTRVQPLVGATSIERVN